MFDSDRLSSVIKDSGVSFKENSKSFIFKCPRCDKKDKLYLRKTDGRFCCFVCKETENFQGKAEYALSELLGVNLSLVKEQLYGSRAKAKQFDELLDEDTDLYYEMDDQSEEDPLLNTPTRSWPYDYYPLDHKHSKRGLKYLEGRGITLNICEKYGLRYSPVERRVCFPITYQGRLLGWQGRFICDSKVETEDGQVKEIPKILSTSDVRRDLLLMFEDRVEDDHIVVCEGPVDAIKADLCGGNVATMGKAISDGQLARIRELNTKKVYLALDPDASSEMDRIVRSLPDRELFHLLPSKGYKDLGEMSPEAVLESFKTAKRIVTGEIFVYLKYG